MKCARLWELISRRAASVNSCSMKVETQQMSLIRREEDFGFQNVVLRVDSIELQPKYTKLS